MLVDLSKILPEIVVISCTAIVSSVRMLSVASSVIARLADPVFVWARRVLPISAYLRLRAVIHNIIPLASTLISADLCSCLTRLTIYSRMTTFHGQYTYNWADILYLNFG